MKQRILLISLALLLTVAWAAFSGQTSGVEEPDRLEPAAFEHLRRPGAVFFHDDHNEAAGIEDCAVCHHVWEDNHLVADESSEDQACSDCHGLSSGVDNPVSLTAAFHRRCRECHFESQKGPVLCGQCHQKS
jgi:hypothetical protein